MRAAFGHSENDDRQTIRFFGGYGDKLAVDFDGDATTDIAVYRSGSWYILPSSGGSYYAVGFGGDPSDIPVNPTAVMFMMYM